jgi:hypothetical protein
MTKAGFVRPTQTSPLAVPMHTGVVAPECPARNAIRPPRTNRRGCREALSLIRDKSGAEADYIANSRTQIAATESASVKADNRQVQSIPAIGKSIGKVPAVGLICIKGKRQPTKVAFNRTRLGPRFPQKANPRLWLGQ